MNSAQTRTVWPEMMESVPDASVLGREAALPPPVLRAGFVFALLATTVFARFGIGLTDDFSISMGMVGLYVVAAALIWSGRARLNPMGALLVAAVLFISALSLFVNQNYAPWRRQVSLNSWALLVMLYLPFALGLRPGGDSRAMWLWLVRMHLAIMIAVTLCGIAQYAVQFVYRPVWLIDYTPLIPAPIRGSGLYNTSNAMSTGLKSNGFFLREPSTFSAYTAFALLLEWSLFRRKWVLALFGMGLMLSYSGSGLLVLAIAMMFPLGFTTLLRAAAAAAVLLVLYLLLGGVLNLDYTLGRVHEFGSDRSSAYCRFILPGKTAVEAIDAQSWVSLLGHGPGTMQKLTASCETTFGKVLFEYGLLGSLALIALIVYSVRQPWVPLRSQAGFFVFWLVLGGHLLGPDALLIIFLLCAMWPRRPAESSGETQDGVRYV